jgi:hypothetical protein
LETHRSGSVSLVDDDGQDSRSIQAQHTMKWTDCPDLVA